MDAKFYEVLALAMRYFFTFLGVMIVWRSFSWLLKDRRQKHRRLKQLPDAGTIGILTVEQGGKHLKPGMILPVPHEGVMGYLRTCDVVVPVEDVATVHLDFTFQDGKGLYIYPRRGCEAMVDGIPLNSRRDSRAYPMQHGSVLEIGQAKLRLGVFAGLNVQEAQLNATLQEDPIIPDPTPEWIPPQSYPQNVPYPPYQAPPYGQMVNPPQQPWYPPAPPQGPSPFAPPIIESDRFTNGTNQPWQGGDGDAE